MNAKLISEAEIWDRLAPELFEYYNLNRKYYGNQVNCGWINLKDRIIFNDADFQKLLNKLYEFVYSAYWNLALTFKHKENALFLNEESKNGFDQVLHFQIINDIESFYMRASSTCYMLDKIKNILNRRKKISFDKLKRDDIQQKIIERRNLIIHRSKSTTFYEPKIGYKIKEKIKPGEDWWLDNNEGGYEPIEKLLRHHFKLILYYSEHIFNITTKVLEDLTKDTAIKSTLISNTQNAAATPGKNTGIYSKSE